ncbi:PSD1 and planctomycete cytochrome C domain-containing protein [Sphingobacterium mizutaii]|uniref:PSD1 and planctomycete cytochrome C domain-containing protein n=1 Tax=Sphingobacterium mizutaii TaxID=1010 RepID=UPI001624B98E|nr:PSD1 and planctomycete cytochrome C domain-containing protein [Sphingobacterium mizutaii]
MMCRKNPVSKKSLSIAAVFSVFGLQIFLLPMCRPGTESGSSDAGNFVLPKYVDYNYDIKPILSDKCFACHGPDNNTREAGLRLDTEEGAYKALAESPDKHAVVPGKPHISEAFLRITSDDESIKMPPTASNLPLSNFEIDLIERWIEQGAVYKPHWAFTAPKKPEVPQQEKIKWGNNEIDNFVLDKMSKAGFKPNPEADKNRLLRRVSLDLTGLPPDEKVMERFLNDDSPQAYEKLVDELMASPAFGEQMALHWMDVARYADSYGYQDDDIRTQWPWRDWVIHAFNENMPYNQFVTWQLAGDLLPNPNKEQILATAFNRNHKITEEGGVVEEEYRVAYGLDKTNTYAKGILGITMECAQCHDHKYDPFTQKNYYGMYAFFNNSLEKGLEGLVNSGPSKTPRLTVTQEDIKGILSFINQNADDGEVTVSVMGERDSIRPTFILDRGVYDAPTVRVYPQTPEAVLPFDSTKYASNRLGLAQWTFSDKNPLTSRVFVNQMWALIFGRGLVASVADFGNQGDLPSHPELLDWLAVDFQQNGWNIKRLIKQLVSTATYKQSSVMEQKHLEKDPDNIFLARAKRLRLPAQMIRDQVLATSGLLNRKIGGPSIKPYQPEGIWEVSSSGRGALAQYVQDHGQDLYRRGMYVFFKLTLPPPNMLIFDASNRDACEVQRQRTNTPLQALVMMNDPAILEASRIYSTNLMADQPNLKQNDYINKVFKRVLCREPTDKELELLGSYYQDELIRFTQNKKDAASFLNVGEAPQDNSLPKEKLAALMSVVHAIYNLEETLNKG